MDTNVSNKQFFVVFFFTLCLFLMGLTIGLNAQVRQDASGNYYAVKAVRDSTNKPTGKTFTSASGETLPVYESKAGKLYVIRVSKASGKSYKQYLKID